MRRRKLHLSMRLVQVAQSRQVILNQLAAIDAVALHTEQGILPGDVLYPKVALNRENLLQRPVIQVCSATADEVSLVATGH